MINQPLLYKNKHIHSGLYSYSFQAIAPHPVESCLPHPVFRQNTSPFLPPFSLLHHISFIFFKRHLSTAQSLLDTLCNVGV